MLFNTLQTFRRSLLGPQSKRRRRFDDRFIVACEQLESRALLSGLTFFQKFEGVDWTSAGAGGIGDFAGGVATINVGPVNGTVSHAYLYWQGIDRGFGPTGPTDGLYDNETVTLDGVTVVGASIGIGHSATSSSSARSQAFRADVTALVRTGSQTYNIGNLAAKAGHSANGVSLVIIYQDGDAGNDRDLYVLNGNHVNAGFNSDGEWSATLSNFVGSSGDARAQLHVADGQSSGDAVLRFTSSTGGSLEIEDDASLFDGVSVPNMGHSRAFDGSLWDINTFNLGSLATTGTQSLSLNQLQGTLDTLSLVVLLFDTSSSPPNTPPVASDLDIAGFEDQPLSGSLPGFDADGDSLTYTIVTPPMQGTLNLNGDTGHFTFTPPANFYGDLSFTYRVWDAGGSSAIATVSMTLAAVNDTPVVSPLKISLDEDSSFDGRIEAFDVDDSVLSYLLIDGPKHGRLQLAGDGSFHFTPNANWNGDDSFTVAVSDGKADPVLTVVPIHVAAVNDAPLVSDSRLVVPINAKSGDAIGVVRATDVDGDPMTYAIVAGDNDGAFVIDSRTGIITIRDVSSLRRGGPRDIVLTVSATDPSGETGVAKVVVTVQMPSIRISVGFRSDSISLTGSPWVPLVIYGSDSLRVRDLDLSSLKFGRTGQEASLKGFRRPLHIYRDVDRDGKLDLVLLVDMRKTGLKVGDQSVSLTGTTKQGAAINGSRSVTVSSGKKPSSSKCTPHKSVPAFALKKRK